MSNALGVATLKKDLTCSGNRLWSNGTTVLQFIEGWWYPQPAKMTMHVSAPRLARSAHGTLIGLLLLVPAGAAAQEPAAAPSVRESISAGFAIGALGYRLGTLELARGSTGSRTLRSARLLVGSRPRFLCGPTGPTSVCNERATLVALLGGLQWVPFGNVVEPYLGGQLGIYGYDVTGSGTFGLIGAAQVGLRLRLGSLGGAYGDASFLMAAGGGFPIAGIGLYLRPGSLRGIIKEVGG